MNLEDEIVKELSTQMQSEIDFEILAGMLVELGWHRIDLTRFTDNYHAIDVRLWCEEHIKNPYQSRARTFIFENSGDAINFTLRWK